MELCFLLKNGCDDIPGMGCMSEGVGKSDRFACFKTAAKATESTTPSGQTGLVGSVVVVGRQHRFSDFDPIIALNHKCPACDKKTVNENTKFCYKCGVGIEFADY